MKTDERWDFQCTMHYYNHLNSSVFTEYIAVKNKNRSVTRVACVLFISIHCVFCFFFHLLAGTTSRTGLDVQCTFPMVYRQLNCVACITFEWHCHACMEFAGWSFVIHCWSWKYCFSVLEIEKKTSAYSYAFYWLWIGCMILAYSDWENSIFVIYGRPNCSFFGEIHNRMVRSCVTAK